MQVNVSHTAPRTAKERASYCDVCFQTELQSYRQDHQLRLHSITNTTDEKAEVQHMCMYTHTHARLCTVRTRTYSLPQCTVYHNPNSVYLYTSHTYNTYAIYIPILQLLEKYKQLLSVLEGKLADEGKRSQQLLHLNEQLNQQNEQLQQQLQEAAATVEAWQRWAARRMC